MRNIGLTLAIVLASWGSQARADLVVTNIPYVVGFQTNNFLTTFTTGPSDPLTFDSLTLRTNVTSGGTADFTVSIFNDNAGVPEAIPIDSLTINSGGTTNLVFDFANFPLTANTPYWVQFERTNEVGGSAEIGVTFVGTEDSSFGWTIADGATVPTFSVSAVPEPSTVGLLAFASIGGLALVWRRRRRRPSG